MKYRHAHHAGNFADVVKHVVLIELLAALKRKPSPFFYLETHAGRGQYSLPPMHERPGTEFGEGFGRLLATAPGGPLERYVSLIKELGGSGHLARYSGSPAIASALLRPGDRAAFFELQAEEARALRELMGRRKGVAVHCADGYEALRSQLPPPERRGLVFIDPAYEEQEREFAKILEGVREGLKRWATGVYAIWYPIKRAAPVRRFQDEIAQLGARRVLAAELCIYPPDSRASLNGSGMIVINAPWQVDAALKVALPALHSKLAARPGTAAGCSWLVAD